MWAESEPRVEARVNRVHNIKHNNSKVLIRSPMKLSESIPKGTEVNCLNFGAGEWQHLWSRDSLNWIFLLCLSVYQLYCK